MASWGWLGVVSFAIIGMFYKIIPFLVWYGSYSRQIGLRKVPHWQTSIPLPCKLGLLDLRGGPDRHHHRDRPRQMPSR